MFHPASKRLSALTPAVPKEDRRCIDPPYTLERYNEAIEDKRLSNGAQNAPVVSSVDGDAGGGGGGGGHRVRSSENSPQERK